MSRYPTNLSIRVVSMTTSAAINTFVNTVFSGTPGVTSRYRIWYMTFAVFSANTGDIFVSLRNTAGTIVVGELTAPPKSSPDTLYFPGGFALPVSDGLNILHESDVANQNIRMQVGYTVELVA